ncbi:Uncharacterised protein [Mycobacterium tuberculosis]|nr:Uncharacterised protein [Mycobacterium tuberculosis]
MVARSLLPTSSKVMVARLAIAAMHTTNSTNPAFSSSISAMRLTSGALARMVSHSIKIR